MNNLLDLIYVLGTHLGETITLRQLALDARLPYTTVHRRVNTNKELFVLEKKGSAILCSLNIKDKIMVSYLSLAERKKANKFYNTHKEISILRKEFPEGDHAVILFGSRAVGKERKESDIDILVINKEGKKNMSFSKYELLFKLKINPIFMSLKEFIYMQKEKEHNLFNEVIKKHIILYGESYFWGAVFKNGI